MARGSRELQLQHAKHQGLPPELRAHAEKLEAAVRRIHHLKVAAENLKMAEAHDLAHDIMEKAESMEREVHEGKKRLDAEIQNFRLGEHWQRREHWPEHVMDIVQALKTEIEHLRAEVKELRQNVEKRSMN
jgi:prefoldin subunit 5